VTIWLLYMIDNDQDLLRKFTREQSQDAFTALVSRYVNLVYSAAVRQVRSPHLAEEVSQSVFIDLARHAGKLKPNTVLTAWLYQVTRNAAIDVVRRETRRQAREQIAFQMNEINHTSSDWTHIEPLLDEAMQSLDDSDRTAILLRFFENKSLREVGDALGSSEDAAQKRVGRAVESLREFFSKRKVAMTAGGLTALISANAVQAAPSGLAAALGTGTVLAASALSSSTAVPIANTIVMTTLQKTIVAVALAGTVVGLVYQARQVSSLRQQVQHQKEAQKAQAALKDQMQELQQEHHRATNALAAVSAENAALKKNPNAVLKLRNEVGRLRQENASLGSTSGLSKLTANPETRKMVREQQKMGMTMIYKKLGRRLNLAPDQTEKFHDLLADHIMENIDLVTTVLRDKPTSEQMREIFTAQDVALNEKVQRLLGQEALEQYQQYGENLLSSITAEQFKQKLTGTETEKDEKARQLSQVLQEESQAVLSSEGLPKDYQTVPMLNFRNIASEQDAERSLKLLEDIYQRAAARGGSFLSPDEIAQFQEFKSLALTNNRSALTLNRTLMAPIAN
jgi:RNA polymerase sigma factor (sigma-70 family)